MSTGYISSDSASGEENEDSITRRAHASSKDDDDDDLNRASNLLGELLEAGVGGSSSSSTFHRRNSLTQSGERLLSRDTSRQSYRRKLRPVSRERGPESNAICRDPSLRDSIAVKSASHVAPVKALKSSPLIVPRRRINASVFWKALEEGDWEWVETYLDRGVARQTSIHPTRGRRPLHIASNLGWTEIVRGLLNRTDVPNLSMRSMNGKETALHFAVAASHSQIVEILLSKGAPTNIKNSIGYTPLHYAQGNAGFEIAKMLLDANCDQTSKCNQGFTACELAMKRGDEAIAVLLKDQRIAIYKSKQRKKVEVERELAIRRIENAKLRRKAKEDKFKEKMRLAYAEWRNPPPRSPSDDGGDAKNNRAPKQLRDSGR